MARDKLSIVVGSNAPLIVQLYPVDSDTGANGISLTGATSLSAKAILSSGGTAISFSSATVNSASLGKVQLDYTTGAFASAGTYHIQVKYTDSGGKIHIYPSDGNTLKLLVKEAIT